MATLRQRALVNLLYWIRFGRLPDLADPKLFSELVQVRKLTDRNPRFPMLADKIDAKTHVARELGAEWVIPTLWQGTELPLEPAWPRPFVVKSAHGCLQSIFVRNEDIDWTRIRRRAHSWLKRPYGGMLGEWLYSRIDRRILIEPFVGEGGRVPTDYKIFVFGGTARLVQVDRDREHDLRRAIFDTDWNRLHCELEKPRIRDNVDPPRSLPLMLEAAEWLARSFDFVRVDFYEVEGRPLFGEMTFYPGSGLSRFRPRSFDALLGSYWLRARREMAPGGAVHHETPAAKAPTRDRRMRFPGAGCVGRDRTPGSEFTGAPATESARVAAGDSSVGA